MTTPSLSMTQDTQKTDLRERCARIAQNKMAAHLAIDIEGTVAGLPETEIIGTGPASYAIADAVLAIARPAIIEECAELMESHAETYHDQMVISLVRALAEKP